jgi:hypothetical protein
MPKIMLKKILITLFSIILVIALSIAGASWYLYRNQDVIAKYVLAELNDMQRGYTTLEKVNVDLLTNFPYISIDLHHLALYPSKTDTLKPIYYLEDVYLGFNYTDIIAGSYKIKKIAIRKGQIHIEKYEDGSINLLLAKSFKQKAEEKKQEESKFQLKLKQILLEELTITKKDFQSKQFAHLNFTKAVSGFQFDEDFLHNHLETNFEVVEFSIHDSVWFKNKHLHWDTDIDYHLKKNFLAIKPSRFELEGAAFEIQGSVDLEKNAFLDLEIKGRKPDFKLITSFAPEGIYEKLKSYQNKGDIYFIGKIKGEAIDNVPKIDLEFGCKNAEFINPHLKNSIRNLNFKGFFTNGEKRDLSTCELKIQSLSGNPEESVFKGSFHIKNFENPFVSVDFHSKLNLATLRNFFEIDQLKGLQGWLIIDMTIDELLDYNDVPTTLGKLKDGTDSRLILKDVRYQSTFYPNLITLNGEVDIVNGSLVLKEFFAKVGKSDFEMKGEISNLATFLHGKDADMSINLEGKSNFISFKELLSFDKKLATEQDEEITDLRYNLAFKTNSKYLKGYHGIPKGEFFVNNLYLKLKNYRHHIHDWHIDLLIDEDKILVKKFEGEVDKSDFHLEGFLNHYYALTDEDKHNEPFELQIALKSKHLRFDDLFTYKGINYIPKEYQHEVIDNFLVDATLRMPAKNALNGNFFDDMQLNLRRIDGIFEVHHYGLREVGGDFIAKNAAWSIRNFHGRMGKSDFKIDADIENIHKLMASDFKGKKTVVFQSNRLDLDELLALSSQEGKAKPQKTSTEDAPTDHSKAFNIFDLPFPNLDLKADIGDFKYGKYHLENFKTALRIQPNHYIYVDKLEMFTAGGNVAINGYFNGSDPKHIYFSSTIDVKNLDLDKVFYKMDNFGQDYLVNENVHGKITGTIKSRVLMHPDLVINLQDTEAHIEATVKDGRLSNFAPFKMMDKFMGDKDLENVRFGEMSNVFDVKNGNISIPRMEISSTLGYMMISGTQNFDKDLNMKYTVEVPSFIIKDAMWNYFFKRKKRGTTQEMANAEDEIISSEDRHSKRLATVVIEGVPDKIDFDFKGFKKNKREKRN